jgi:hypothetical protein
MNKLPLVFVEKKTWESWISVFYAWKQGELIGEDEKDPTIIPRLHRAHITKIDVAPMLGLRDSDLVLLAKEIFENKVCIKTNVACRDRLTLLAGIASHCLQGSPHIACRDRLTLLAGIASRCLQGSPHVAYRDRLTMPAGIASRWPSEARTRS